MPTQGSLTNAGAAGLMTGGAPLSGYLQIGRDSLPQADWQTATAVPGAFRALPINRAIVATQTTLQALDDVDTEAYDDLASIGFWNMDPAMAGAELWWLGTAAAGEVLSVKTLNNDLIWTVALMLTPAQVANLSFDVSIETVPRASETVFGITRYATDAQARATEANASDERTSTIAKLWTWWNSISVPASKLTGVLATARIPNLSASKITSGMLGFGRLPAATQTEAERANSGDNDSVMTPYRTRQAIEELSPTADVQTFNASGTWPKPTGARSVEVIGWNGGGNGAISTGGVGGGAFFASLPASLLPNLVSVTVGANEGLSNFGGTGLDGLHTPFASDPASHAQGWEDAAGNKGYGHGFAQDGTDGGAGGGPFTRSDVENTASREAVFGGGGAGGIDGENGQIPGGAGGRNALGAQGRMIVTTYF